MIRMGSLSMVRPTGRFAFSKSVWSLGLLFGMSMGIIGCESMPGPDESEQQSLEDLPKVSEMLERFGPEQPGADAMPEQVAEPQALYIVERLVMPLNQPMNAAWSVVDEAVVSETKLQVLHRNGIRVGLLPMSDLARFDAGLPRRSVTTRFRAVGSRKMESLVRQPLKQNQALVELSVPPDVPQSYRMAGGSVQMLHQAIAGPAGSVSLRLLPHHHRVRPSVQVRSHLDTRYDGRMFHELMMTLSPKPDQLVVLGLYWPWTPRVVPEDVTEEEQPEPEAESEPQSDPDEPSTQDDAEGSDNEPDPTPSEEKDDVATEIVYDRPARLPPTLGAALFTGQQVGRPVQVLLVMRVVAFQPSPTITPETPEPPETPATGQSPISTEPNSE